MTPVAATAETESRESSASACAANDGARRAATPGSDEDSHENGGPHLCNSNWLPAGERPERRGNDCEAVDFGWRATSEACLLLNQVLGVVEESVTSMMTNHADEKSQSEYEYGDYGDKDRSGGGDVGGGGGGGGGGGEGKNKKKRKHPNPSYQAPKLTIHGADRLCSEWTPLADYSWRWVKPLTGRQGLHVSPDGKTASGTFGTRSDYFTAVGSMPFTGRENRRPPLTSL